MYARLRAFSHVLQRASRPNLPRLSGANESSDFPSWHLVQILALIHLTHLGRGGLSSALPLRFFLADQLLVRQSLAPYLPDGSDETPAVVVLAIVEAVLLFDQVAVQMVV